MDMDLGRRFLDRVQDVEIGLTRIVRMNASLHAHLCCPTFPAFASSPLYFVNAEIVGSAAQVFGGLAFRKGAELAVVITDVRVIYVSVDSKGNRVPVYSLTKLVRRINDRLEIIASCPIHPHDLGLPQIFPTLSPRDNFRDITRNRHFALS